jgi:predicted MFS family arabinose efflux permease
MVGLGGISGSLFGGYLCESGLEAYCFALKSMLGFMIAAVAFTMDKQLEKDARSFND